jgi:tetratricopeptide (TPR) repeat protein
MTVFRRLPERSPEGVGVAFGLRKQMATTASAFGRKRTRKCIALLPALIYLAFALEPVEAQRSPRPVPSPLTTQLNQALTMAEQGHEDGALAIVNALVAQNPHFAPALKLQGAILEKVGRTEEAEQSYRQALDESPRDPALLFKLGTLDLALGDNEHAAAYLLRDSRLSPRDADVLFYLAQAYRLTGQYDLALDAIKKGVAMAPKDPQLLQLYGDLLVRTGDNQRGLQQLLKVHSLNPDLEKLDFDIARASFNRMNFADAASYSVRAAERDPNDLETMKLLAAAEEKVSQWEKAKLAFQQVLSLQHDDVVSLLGAAHCELELKQYREAIDTLHQVLVLDANQALAHYYLSRAFSGVGQTEQSQAEAELYRWMEQMSFIPAAPEAETGEAAWNHARELLEQHREDEALKQFLKDSDGKVEPLGDAYVLVGSLYLSMGNSTDGLRMLRHALQIEPSARGAHTYIGHVDIEQDRLNEAEREFSAELKNDPNYLPAIAALGQVRYTQGQWGEAAELLTKSKTRTPGLLYMLCDAYFHLGKTHEAKLTAQMLAAFAQKDSSMIQQLDALMARNGDTSFGLNASSGSIH